MGPINPSEQLKLTHLPRDLSLGVPGEKPSRRSHHQPNQPNPNQAGSHNEREVDEDDDGGGDDNQNPG
ncbi:hypothetical protein TorRG33x02_257640 [Trema orientale]|uniref:Uncharacterized protein n=1 Tax=Trema orientale TaxID=63057 RepID=A0A2P5DAA2_TREOI|nr:hypothetical protein TorRG33x02_257640 [Trema orientale]